MYFNHVHKHFNIEYFVFVMNIFITNVMVKTQSKYLHFLVVVVVAFMGHYVLSPICHPSDRSQNAVSIDSTFVWLSGAISSLGGCLEKCNPKKLWLLYLAQNNLKQTI